MSREIILLEKTYEGFEDVYDLGRDIEEIWDYPQDEEAKKIIGEFEGKLVVKITFIPEEGDIK